MNRILSNSNINQNQKVAIKIAQPINISSEEIFLPYRPESNILVAQTDERIRQANSSSSMTMKANSSEFEVDPPSARISMQFSAKNSKNTTNLKKDSLIKISD